MLIPTTSSTKLTHQLDKTSSPNTSQALNKKHTNIIQNTCRAKLLLSSFSIEIYRKLDFELSSSPFTCKINNDFKARQEKFSMDDIKKLHLYKISYPKQILRKLKRNNEQPKLHLNQAKHLIEEAGSMISI